MELREVAKPSEINAAVRRLALRINRDYKKKNPVVVGVLKGSFIFMSDLVRRLNMPVHIDFIRAESYGSGCVSKGVVNIKMDIEADIGGRDVIIVDDILDTGLTLKAIIKHINTKKPATVSVCVLLDKPSRRETEVDVDYIGMVVEDKFLVGYGLDYSERYRNLKGLHELKQCGPEKP